MPAFLLAAGSAQGDPVAGLVLSLALILLVAKLGGDLAARIGQPTVLGELLGGILLGNVPLFGHSLMDRLKNDPSVDMLGRIGALIVLGAAVIDDVLGLLVLAVVAAVATAADKGKALSGIVIGVTVAKAVVFVVGAIAAGMLLSPRLFRLAARLRARGVLVAVGLSFCFVLAWLSDEVGLAPIVGAFAAGLVLEEVHSREFTDRGERAL